jgi:hypothetical protein
MLFPAMLSRLNTKRLLILSQISSGSLVAITAIYASFATLPSATYVLALFFLQNIFQRFFEGARESYSRGLGSHSEQRTLQAELLHGLYSAQVIGPIAAFILIVYVSMTLPLYLDAGSFLIAAMLCLRLPSSVNFKTSKPANYSIFSPLVYIWKDRALAEIFLLRAVGFWIPVGISNYLVFNVITDHYNLTVIHSAWSFAATGLGATLSSIVLRYYPTSGANTLFQKFQRYFWNVSDGKIAFSALVVFGLTQVAFLKLPSLGMALFFIFIGGVCAGFNAISTQSLRRKITPLAQFPEVLGLEMLVSKLTDWVIASLCFWIVAEKKLTYEDGIWVAAISLVLLGVLHLSPSLEQHGKNILVD